MSDGRQAEDFLVLVMPIRSVSDVRAVLLRRAGMGDRPPETYSMDSAIRRLLPPLFGNNARLFLLALSRPLSYSLLASPARGRSGRYSLPSMKPSMSMICPSHHTAINSPSQHTPFHRHSQAHAVLGAHHYRDRNTHIYTPTHLELGGDLGGAVEVYFVHHAVERVPVLLPALQHLLVCIIITYTHKRDDGSVTETAGWIISSRIM